MIRDDGFWHIYPDLTLATNQLLAYDEGEFILIYLHENLYWLLSKHPDNFYVAMNDL